MEKERIQTWLGLTQRHYLLGLLGQPGADCPYLLGQPGADCPYCRGGPKNVGWVEE